MTEKDIKKRGFQLCELRFAELSPVLQRLNELELQQRENEDFSRTTLNSNNTKNTRMNNNGGKSRR